MYLSDFCCVVEVDSVMGCIDDVHMNDNHPVLPKVATCAPIVDMDNDEELYVVDGELKRPLEEIIIHQRRRFGFTQSDDFLDVVDFIYKNK